jgi:hypothetical protein
LRRSRSDRRETRRPNRQPSPPLVEEVAQRPSRNRATEPATGATEFLRTAVETGDSRLFWGERCRWSLLG